MVLSNQCELQLMTFLFHTEMISKQPGSLKEKKEVFLSYCKNIIIKTSIPACVKLHQCYMQSFSKKNNDCFSFIYTHRSNHKIFKINYSTLFYQCPLQNKERHTHTHKLFIKYITQHVLNTFLPTKRIISSTSTIPAQYKTPIDSSVKQYQLKN